MRQKLGVIAALLHRPELLILDEPTTGVDPVNRSGLWWLIAAAAADGTAVVLATTYLDDAQRAASVLVLDVGRQLATGTPEQIVSAMPGSVRGATSRPSAVAGQRAWRRGAGWRVWYPPDADVQDGAGLGALEPDLQDACRSHTLAREQHETAAAPAGPQSAEPQSARPQSAHLRRASVSPAVSGASPLSVTSASRFAEARLSAC